MKKNIFLSIALIIAGLISAQESNSKIPSVEIKSLDGKTVKSDEISNEGNPVIISFWATWCVPCVKELSAIADLYDDWKEETMVKLVAISIDDTRSTSRVSPFINGKGWEYDVYLDSNSELKKAMNVINIPHTFLLNGAGEIVWQHTGYAEGDEEELYNMVKKLANGEEIEH
ncbi:MAG: TlpA disulfide reductase family protein [Bacteroidota bacterium]